MTNRLALLLVITFIESFATICVERAVYFLTNSNLHFSDALNLWLALTFGVAYLVGALVSHPMAKRFGEKQVLLASIWAQLITHAAFAIFWKQPSFIFSGSVVIGFLNGLKWPVIESYVSAGLAPRSTARVIGWFNMSWAGSVPLMLLVGGPIIAWKPEFLFLIPAAINLVTLILCVRLERRPVHLPADHPLRPTQEVMTYLKSMLAGSRWLMLASYSSMWVLVALMPTIFDKLGLRVSKASGASGLLDVVRWGAFMALQFWSGWHYRARYLIAGLIGLPAGFFMVLYGPDLTTVLAGEVVFGLSAGLIYYSALFYAMIVKNASVEAGGAHEGLIGAGFAIGPIAGLIGIAISDKLHRFLPGVPPIMLGVGSVFAICFVGTLVTLIKGGRRPAGLQALHAPQTPEATQAPETAQK